MTVLITVIIFGLVLSSIWAFGVYQERQRCAVWQSLADEFGGEVVDSEAGYFSHDSSKALLLRFEGFPVRMDTFSILMGSHNSKSRVEFLRVRIMVEEGYTAEIYEEVVAFSFFGSVSTLDVVVGHPDYDELFIVKSSSPRWLKSRLSAEVFRAHLSGRKHSITLHDNGLLECTRRGSGDDAAVCRAAIELAVTYARAFSTGRALDAPPSRPELPAAAPPAPLPDGDAW